MIMIVIIIIIFVQVNAVHVLHQFCNIHESKNSNELYRDRDKLHKIRNKKP